MARMSQLFPSIAFSEDDVDSLVGDCPPVDVRAYDWGVVIAVKGELKGSGDWAYRSEIASISFDSAEAAIGVLARLMALIATAQAELMVEKRATVDPS